MLYFIGIDISKSTLDLSVIANNRELLHLRINNDQVDINKAINQLKQQYKDLAWENTLFCLEPTGVYNVPVMSYLASHNANIWLQAARQIKSSRGLQREKQIG